MHMVLFSIGLDQSGIEVAANLSENWFKSGHNFFGENVVAIFCNKDQVNV